MINIVNIRYFPDSLVFRLVVLVLVVLVADTRLADTSTYLDCVGGGAVEPNSVQLSHSSGHNICLYLDYWRTLSVLVLTLLLISVS